jgi:hypothetical protein
MCGKGRIGNKMTPKGIQLIRFLREIFCMRIHVYVIGDDIIRGKVSRTFEEDLRPEQDMFIALQRKKIGYRLPYAFEPEV